MKIRFLFFLVFHCSFSQVNIKGKVYDSKGPLEGAAIYFNSTMVGTTTNSEGEFSIKTEEGHFELIISYLGYKTIRYNLYTNEYKKPLVFALEENRYTLDEVVLKKIKYDKKWKANLKRFYREFFGNTKLSKDCKIINPKTLFFYYNSKDNIFNAFTKAPLIIRHNGLGYSITYDLVYFSVEKDFVKSLGYSQFKNLQGSKHKKRTWKKNRLVTYNGSVNHFLKSILANRVKREGFVIEQFIRLPNKERPSDTEIKKARKKITSYKKTINFSRKIENPVTDIDSALVTIRKSNLPKLKDSIYKKDLKSKDILVKKEGKLRLDFKNNLLVIYKKEKEEKNYRRRGLESSLKFRPQMSTIIPTTRPILIDKNGILDNPLDLVYEGYWAFERFANFLPLDYNPKKD
ncbi:carboxypeptidase-like regulatory domain-containing protein [Polaribacter aquimarinus]|uniref:Carboxypeptidase-like regulatory domain-containing protein n=1 Tax=Polaribacter aquimarinus TaxID=2100726 RepID=A0A2U2JCP9_9FLAO|nr:carboxypeptidase-like regulatory domain-containing protein [Polaribacter aquimarinus]PWG06120.1 hypothetical protein DIS07_06730 [Polaribacter aquimarinus]